MCPPPWRFDSSPEQHEEGQYKQYREVLDHPSRIFFARYDVSDVSHAPPLGYAFTAKQVVEENERHTELALRLPSHQRWSYELIDWIIEHHEGVQPLARNRVNRESLVEALSGNGESTM